VATIYRVETTDNKGPMAVYAELVRKQSLVAQGVGTMTALEARILVHLRHWFSNLPNVMGLNASGIAGEEFKPADVAAFRAKPDWHFGYAHPDFIVRQIPRFAFQDLYEFGLRVKAYEAKEVLYGKHQVIFREAVHVGDMKYADVMKLTGRLGRGWIPLLGSAIAIALWKWVA
jgi:hypothetical protein